MKKKNYIAPETRIHKLMIETIVGTVSLTLEGDDNGEGSSDAKRLTPIACDDDDFDLDEYPSESCAYQSYEKTYFN